jgi:hypothetical protein
MTLPCGGGHEAVGILGIAGGGSGKCAIAVNGASPSYLRNMDGVTGPQVVPDLGS